MSIVPMSGSRSAGHQFNIQRNITEQNNKCYSSHVVKEDRLSQLPDECLVSIISQLTLREVALTSCLSSRWRDLWMYVTRLNFNVTEFIDEDARFYPSLCRKEGLSNMSWINHVLDSHKGGFTLEEFSVSFPFATSFKCEIDKWIKFASSKKVKSLKIDFSVNCREGIFYTFPPSVLSGFEALKVLALNWVDVDNQVVNFFLSRCHFLEQLSIQCSRLLKDVKIVGPSLKLKHLEICYCPIYSLEIRNVNLGSFTFKGWEITNLLLENVTSVHNVDIKGTMCESESQLVRKIMTNFTQLETLSIEPASYFRSWGVPLFLAAFDDSFPKFDNLKVLSLRLTIVSTVFLVKVTPLLELSPYLQKFTIELDRAIVRFPKNTEGESVCRSYVKRSHEHLKEVIYRGYLGDTNDLALTTYLFEYTFALEKLTVDPRIQIPYSSKNCKMERKARRRARRQLEGKVPKGVKLIIL